MQRSQKERILELKRLRLEQGLTYQDIVSHCEAHGEAVSLSTVKRVFAKGSEDGYFRQDTTLDPIARVLKGVEPEDAEAKGDLPEKLIQEQSVSLDWYKETLGAARRRERTMLFIIAVLVVALYGMIDYFVFPTSLLFRPGL